MTEAKVTLPTCCFNGGTDVWCDLGNKAIGVAALQRRMGLSASQCVHVGDQFATSIGNDYAARCASPTLWVAGPKETQHILKQLLERRGISTKSTQQRAWPPSTKRRSVFSNGQELVEEAKLHGATEADWVRG